MTGTRAEWIADPNGVSTEERYAQARGGSCVPAGSASAFRGRRSIIAGATTAALMLAHINPAQAAPAPTAVSGAEGQGTTSDEGADEPDEWQPADQDRYPEHHVRSLLTMGSVLAVWSVLYWLMMDRNVADWDNPKPLERFDGRAWRLDNNSLPVNFIAHPLMGGGSYSLARANHHHSATSFGYSFLSSFLWEFVLEFKEKVSVNDIIVTPGTGVPVGEFFYKLGMYLDTARNPSTGMVIAQWMLGTGVALDRTLDGRPAPQVRNRDNLGLSRAIWHAFALHSGVDFVTTPTTPGAARSHAGFQGKLVTIPGYLREGNLARPFYNAEVSDFKIAAEASEHGAGLIMSADTLVAGYHEQQLTASAQKTYGHAVTIGASMAFRYLQSKANDYSQFREAAALPQPAWDHHVPKTSEQFSAFHMPGAAVDWHLFAGDVSLSLSGRAHPDFVGLGAPAFYDWASANLQEKGKHILHRQGYFYGWGGSWELAMILGLGPMHLAGNVFRGSYWSQDGLDRHVERISVDVPASGHLLFYGGSVGIQPLSLPLSLQAEFGVRQWYSRVAEFERRDWSASRGLSAVFRF